MSINMDIEMETSPDYFNPEDLSIREQFRRYGKRQSTSSFSPLQKSHVSRPTGDRILYDGNGIQRKPNAALFLEEIKQEVESYEVDGLEGTLSKTPYTNKRRASFDRHGVPDIDGGPEAFWQRGSPSLKSLKHEDDALIDGGETAFTLFASLFDSARQGLMPFPDLILQFESTCRDVSKSISYGDTGRHRVVEDKLMRQKARVLLEEAASWLLLWFLFGKGNEELPETLILSPTTSHLEACQFVMTNHTAQLCLRIVQWLEGLASEALDLEMKVKGCHVGSYLPSSGVWHHTQRFLKKKNTDHSTIQHLDFDAPTREVSQLLPDDKKQDESLLEDIWVLLRAGRLEEACELCRSAGQPWRAATLCPFGGLDQFPSIEALQKNGKNRLLQAIELESGIGHQWHLWKWASYCASERIGDQDGGRYETAVYAAQCSNLKRLLPICTDWESACWAMAKSWLDFQVDSELVNFEPGRLEKLKNYRDSLDESGQEDQSRRPLGPEVWPLHVLDQQPRDLPALLQKLHSGDMVHEAVSRACKEQHRQIQMNLMAGDIAHLVDLIWSWVSPLDYDQHVFRPHGDPQMIRFGAHLVVVLRYLLADEMKDALKEKLTIIGDRILQMYAMYLFSKQQDELVGLYASQLACHLCIDLFVQMMELRLNDSAQVKYKLFLSAMEYLPFSPGDDPRGCFEDIIERVLSRSREIKIGKYDEKSPDVAEQHRIQSLQKAMAIQWLCFTPPSTINDFEVIKYKLLVKALMHSNILFREFALISMWRVPKMPIGAHMLLSFLAEPLKQPTDAFISIEDHDFSENMHEFENWREYYSCDATYRSWLKIELENAEVPPLDLSIEEKERAIAAARETLNSSLLLLRRKGNPWLTTALDNGHESIESVFLELHATAMLCLPSGECMPPDATSCTTLTSALYSSVSEEVVLTRQLMVNVAISQRDSYRIEVVLRCLAVEGDGLGLHERDDGGLLATVMAAGFKGELARFQAGVTMEISQLDAWYSNHDGSLTSRATYIVLGLCHKCCLPELILRCMQVSVSLAEAGDSFDARDELIELVASPESGLINLFSQHQLQEFLLFEREYSIAQMESQEDISADD